MQDSSDQGFSAWLDKAMRAQGMTRAAELSDRSGINDATISRWVNKGNQPSVEHLRRLVGPLKTPLIQLLVVAGHITLAEAGLRDSPEPPQADPAWSKLDPAMLDAIADSDEATVAAIWGVIHATRRSDQQTTRSVDADDWEPR